MNFFRDVVAGTFIALALPAMATAQTTPHPTFAHDIAPVFYQYCSSCHRPAGPAPFSLLSYEDAKQHANQIVSAVRDRSMPPWLPEPGHGDFIDADGLTDAQVHLILDWVEHGLPEGPASEIPPPPQFTEGWQLGPPDMILEAARPFSLPASSSDVFWNFIFSPGLTATRYVRAVEIHPGNAEAIHHANLLIDRLHSARHLEAKPGTGFPGMELTLAHNPFDFPSHFLFWKPGSTPWVEPDGLSWRLDPGNDLVLNAHLMAMNMDMPMQDKSRTPQPMQVQPSIGLYFTDKPPTQFPMLIQLEHDSALEIPAGDRDFVVSDDFRLPLDAAVLAVYPHAHYLGHLLEGYATLPNGERRWLIRIPDWDPKWQAVYHYREPVFLPGGSIVSMRWHYDNSTSNPRNPNRPPRRVEGGNESTDEMGHLWLQVLPHGRGDPRRELAEAVARHRLEKDPDNSSAYVMLGALMLARLDPAGATSELENAVRLAPKQPEARNWLGVSLEAVGRLPEAIAEFRTALDLDPDYADASYNLAKALAKSGQLDEAGKYFSLAVAAYPRDAQVRCDFGELLLQAGKPADALEQFNQALAIDPSHQAARTDRDVALRRLAAR